MLVMLLGENNQEGERERERVVLQSDIQSAYSQHTIAYSEELGAIIYAPHLSLLKMPIKTTPFNTNKLILTLSHSLTLLAVSLLAYN